MAGEDRLYIVWLHGEPCAAQPCPATDIEASHPRTGGGGGRLGGKPGKGQRSEDKAAYPLCRRHHGQAQRYEFSRGFFAGWTMQEFKAWEAEQGRVHYARYLVELEALKTGTLPEEKLRKALVRQGFDPKDFAARFGREYSIEPQIILLLARDLARELKEAGIL